MIRLSLLIVGLVAGALALSNAAFAQQTPPAFAQQTIGEVPSPGTIEDPRIPIKLVADGAPRRLSVLSSFPMAMTAVAASEKQIVIAAAPATR
jgi:hypothetical protein